MQDNRLGTALQSMRRARSLSLMDLAELAGCTAAAVEQFEAGEARIPALFLSRFATGLGVPLSALFTVPPSAMPSGATCLGAAGH